jgi:NADPH:quinone reductase-like Zn-dependent oxidoreductase
LTNTAVDVLKVVEAPVPEPGQGEALIKVKAASINPGEAKIREGLLHARWPATFPSGEGSDFAGIVTKVGPGVGSVKVGDEVIGFTEKRASRAEYVVAEARDLTPKQRRSPGRSRDRSGLRAARLVPQCMPYRSNPATRLRSRPPRAASARSRSSSPGGLAQDPEASDHGRL